jgi:hypothetical protein
MPDKPEPARPTDVDEAINSARKLPPADAEQFRQDVSLDEFRGSFDDSIYPPGYLSDMRDEWRDHDADERAIEDADP